jgi:hypothetical protein
MKVNFNVLNQKSAPALYESSLANRPTAGYMGRLFIDTDIPSTGIYWDSGTVWYKIASASTAETQSLNDVCVIGNNTVTLGTYIFGQSTYGQKSGAAIPVEPNYALTIGRGDSVNDKSLYVAFNSILNGLVNVIGGNTASNPGLKVSGGWFTGGSATTTKPQLLVEPDGTTSTGWSTLGTGIGINAATGFTGRLFDFQINAVSKAILYASGDFVIGRTTDAGFALDVNGSVRIGASVITGNYGNITLNNNGTAAVQLTFSNNNWGTSDAAVFGSQGSNANGSSQLEIKSTTKGFLPPRMTTAQKLAIAGGVPAAGLIVYDTTLNKLCVFTTAWETITSL